MNYKLIKFLDNKLKGNIIVKQNVEEIITIPNELIDENDNSEILVEFLKTNNIDTFETYCIGLFDDDNNFVKPYMMLFGEFIDDDGEEYPMSFDVVEWDYRVMCSVAYNIDCI